MINKAWLLGLMMPMFLAGLPASSSYELDSYGFGAGGTGSSSSANYAVNGAAGQVAGSATSTHYKAAAGENHVKEANVPLVTLSNPGSWYNKLQLNIDPQGNPSDALFAVAISTDGFVTTQYVKSDLTIGSTLSFSDYQTYTAWGGASGVILRGLHHGTVYSAKAKAYRGKFTESAYGPASTGVTTDDPSLSFDIDVSATDTSTSPPYSVVFGSLPVSTVTDSPVRVWVSIDSNAESGAKVYVSGKNTGLTSASVGYTINSVTGDLSSLAEGYGVQGLSATQSSGGPLALVSPYDGTGANVGIVDTLIREIFSASAPVTAGRGSFILKAKTKPLTPAAGDYTETLTAIASASF